MRMSPARSGSTALQHFECGNVTAIRNGIMFNFYPGLPHILIVAQFRIQQAMIQPNENNMLKFPNNSNVRTATHLHTDFAMWWDIVTLVGHCISTCTDDLCY